MAVVRPQALARKLGKSLAQELASDPNMLRLWARPVRDRVEFWVLTEPIDMEAELHIYESGIEFRERVPGNFIRFHVINPGNYEDFELEGMVPADAEEMPLSAFRG